MPVLTLPGTGRSPTVRAKALVFEDSQSAELLKQIELVAPSDATVLITGETGTGKEIVARHLHELSRRHGEAFVAVNCGAIAEQLVESELFGHEKGAFTGAQTSRAGWFETAHRGSLFLDEVGDLSLSLQVKLLRVLQEAEVVRLGSRAARAIDVRLIAATNVDLEEAMAAGHFREDLFYRLNVTQLKLLPLRERPGDILPLARHFVGVYQRKLDVQTSELSASAEQRLVEHSWPGNIRELENVVHHALLVARGERVEADDLRLSPLKPRGRASVPAGDGFSMLETALSRIFEAPTPKLFERIEETIVRTAYAHAGKNQLKAARLLDISRNVVRARLLSYGDLAGTSRPPASERPVAAPASARHTRVRLGFHKFGVLTVVKALGTFDALLAAKGIHVEWCEYPAGPEVANAIQSGEVALGVVGDCPSVLAQADDAKFVYVAAEAPAPEAEAIIVHEDSEIRSVADLRGRSVALKRGSNVHYLLIRALEEAGVDYGDVRLTFAVPEKAKLAFESRHVDAWVIWDPLLSSIQHTTRARVLRDGRGLTLNTAYYLANREFANSFPELVDELLIHAVKAVEWAKSNTALVAELVSAQLNISSRAIASWLKRHPATGALTPELMASQQTIADTLYRLQLLPKPIQVAEAGWRRLAS
ncbi:MAG: sigma-54-dependent transcriptional regulator [Polyangiaceae bacterium]|jgi:aliphatic sulfonates family ABC transporter substrate-binding protein|nr:sigma-54-dependent transcriptional regulator [Polyangiaceae bacterium]